MAVIPRFIVSAASPKQFPAESVPEVAFLGRSNVGKSSLINSLLGEKIAKVSATPGRTQTINFFAIYSRVGQVTPELQFVDLPGYGYAKISKSISAEWPKFIDPYLRMRNTLAKAICLIDANVPAQAKDIQLVEWLHHENRPLLLVATKADKLSGNKLRNALRTLSKDFGGETIMPYSAKTGAGYQELWNVIREAARDLKAAAAEPRSALGLEMGADAGPDSEADSEE